MSLEFMGAIRMVSWDTHRLEIAFMQTDFWPFYYNTHTNSTEKNHIAMSKAGKGGTILEVKHAVSLFRSSSAGTNSTYIIRILRGTLYQPTQNGL